MRRIQEWILNELGSIDRHLDEEVEDDDGFGNGNYLDDGDLYDDGVNRNDDTEDGEIPGGISFWSFVVVGSVALILGIYTLKKWRRGWLERKERNTFDALSNGAKEITESFDIGMVEFQDEDVYASDTESPTKAEKGGVYS
eukprot:CAMPEP_0195252384 /NCGR_PEP_ID=MMETSP0706-20130129/3829_1 /TAXON_ID=33640 /ORGANISM="Asterionellopsis glacialis, Strain CCMP134" /LENGTH=140 /DNA_ID=CAMNT_0040304667 /DNA_START=39 /DNA_END=461 /DNA_ORIENTATION=+